jgi:hypothetical protein
MGRCASRVGRRDPGDGLPGRRRSSRHDGSGSAVVAAVHEAVYAREGWAVGAGRRIDLFSELMILFAQISYLAQSSKTVSCHGSRSHSL